VGGFAGLVNLICDGSVISSQTLAETLCDLSGNNSPLQEGVERCFYEHKDDFEAAMSDLFKTRAVAVAAAQQVDPEWPSEESKENSIRRVLLKLGFPIHQDLPRPIGAIHVRDRLQQIHKDFIADKSSGYLTSDKLRSLPLNAWAYVERLLRITIGFYEIFCGTPASLYKLFKQAKKAHSLGPLFKAMQALDDGFRKLPPEQRKQVERDLHRGTPFEGFSFNSYLGSKMLKDYRNFFAHSEIELITIAGSDRVEKGLQATIKLVDELQESGIAPIVIFPIAQGKDEHGRGLLWFVEERHAFLKSEKRCEYVKCMFKRNPDQLIFRSPYLTISHAPHDSAIPHRLYEPLLWALSEIPGVDLDE
jgi:hypothetical protein